MNYYVACFKKYADFNGRATRSEYWYFALFNMIIVVLCVVLIAIITSVNGSNVINIIIYSLLMAYGLATLIPSLAVAVRRMHDLGKSGWMILISLIPIIGGIWLFVLTVLDSVPGQNAYGPNPKGL